MFITSFWDLTPQLGFLCVYVCIETYIKIYCIHAYMSRSISEPSLQSAHLALADIPNKSAAVSGAKAANKGHLAKTTGILQGLLV